MKSKIIGWLSIGLVILMVILFFKSSNESEQPEKQPEQTTKSTIEATKQKRPKDLPAVSVTDWELILVNRDNPITKEETNLKTMKNGYQLDKRIYDAYYDMETAANEAGFSLTVLSSYRSIAQQQEVYDDDIAQQMATGLTREEAVMKTAEYITLPGTSEHHTGLAIDVVDQEWYNQGKGLEEEFSTTPTGQWLAKHGPEFGFIIRYPRGKEALTGINYEPWHLRYVGPLNADFIAKNNLVLEEYIELIKEVE